MFNRHRLMSMLNKANIIELPITNFGIAIAHINGILNRVLSAFEENSTNKIISTTNVN